MIKTTLVGQEKNLELIAQQLSDNKIANAYLIKGSSGLGKKTFAKLMAQAIICDTHTACGECLECKRFLSNNHTNIKYIRKDKTMIKIDQIRDINGFVSKKSFDGKRNVIIIEDAETMNVAAQNTLLKNLEEPQNSVFILTTNTDELLPTIVSRSVVIRPYPVKDTAVFDFMNTQKSDWFSTLDESKLRLISKYSQGNLGLALSLTKDFFEIRSSILSKLFNRDLNWEFKAAEELKDKSVDEITQALLILQFFFRDVYLYKRTGLEKMLNNTDFLTEIKNYPSDGYNAVKAIDNTIGLIQKTNVNKVMLLVNLFLCI